MITAFSTRFETQDGKLISKATIRIGKTIERAIKIAIQKGYDTIVAREINKQTVINYTDWLRERKQKLTSKAA